MKSWAGTLWHRVTVPALENAGGGTGHAGRGPGRVVDVCLASWAVAMLAQVAGAGLSVPNVERWVFKK